MMQNCLYQPVRFKRTKRSKWEAGSLYTFINTGFTVIEDINNNKIDIDSIYQYKANWFSEV